MAKLDYPAALEAAQNLRDGNLRLTTAATTRIDDLRTEVNEIVEAIEGVREMAGIWVSDKSRLLDFGCSDSQAQELRDLFGIEVDVNDHIWELAERLRQKREG